MNSFKSFLIKNDENIVKETYFWNTLGGLLNAGQSAFLLIIISRTNPTDDAGIYSIGYAIACLALTVAAFGMRNFQASDVVNKYSFRTYFYSRIITDIAMIIVLVYYIVRGKVLLEYSNYKCLSILFLGLLKLVDATEDVFHGAYQCGGRLDVGARCGSIRYIIWMTVFTLSLLFSHNLLLSSIIGFAVSLIVFLYTTFLVFSEFNNSGIMLKNQYEKRHESFNRVFPLLIDCFSIFAGTFLAIYIANIPKYAIDEFCDEIVQAQYSYIFMPVYVVTVLNSLIFGPIITKMALLNESKEYDLFFNLFVRQLLIILALITCVLLGGYFLGIPVLSVLYNSDLSELKKPFMILLIGSGFLAFEGYLQAIITIFRKQMWLLLGFVNSALLSFVFSRKMVMQYGPAGAAWSYTSIVFIQMLIFILFFVFAWKGKERS